MRPVFIILFFLSSTQVRAQLPLLVNEDFDAPNPNWYFSDVDDEKNYRKARNGMLYQEQRAPNIFWTLVTSPLNPTKPFRIETRFKAVEAMKAGMFHIILLGPDEFRLYFGINPYTGKYWIGTNQKDSWVTLNTTTKSSNYAESKDIREGLAENDLAINFENGTATFLVNGKELQSISVSQSLSPLMSSITYIGIATDAPMKTETDYFRIYQDNKINLLTADKLNIKRTRLPGNINTAQTEKWPVMAPDGKTLYFVISGDARSVGGKDNDDIWYSTAINDTTWSAAVNMSAPINNNVHNTVMSVTPDNNTLFLMHQYNADGSYKAAGFSLTHRTATGWSTPEDIVVKDYYNDAEYNEFFLSADRQVLLLALQRKETYGGRDIYFSLVQPDGTYSAPESTGQVINSYGTEMSPFLAADGRTLYFGSYGHAGFGSSDVFVSRRLDDTWKNWSVPQNLGPEINTAAWDAYFTLPASGAYAYVISSETGEGDLYRLDLPKILRPDPVVIVSGRVINSKTNEPVEASVIYSDLLDAKSSGRAQSHPGNGEYKIALPAGKNYAFLAQKDGFYALSESINLKDLKGYEEVKKDLYLTPVEAGQTIRLNNIFFDTNKSDLKPESSQELDRVVVMLSGSQTMTLEVDGHTDNVGEDGYNVKLSQARAEAVVKYLIAKGVKTAALTSKGFGKGKPITTNQTEAGRAVNRRVEFTIVTK
ncbi:MAG TPA: OmpA family protein [Cyclobacteriaceae bacterium]|nr:OmpA family protein [Cyclobacteriaceae bacterium]